MSDSYSVNMRRDTKTGEDLAFIPSAYRSNDGDRYYMAFTLMDGWCELTPEYATKRTKTVEDFDTVLKRAVESNLGYTLNLAIRLS